MPRKEMSPRLDKLTQLILLAEQQWTNLRTVTSFAGIGKVHTTPDKLVLPVHFVHAPV
jgi:hypothetical protein